MSNLFTPICILTSDWHLSHDPPRTRAETREEWYDLQWDYLQQIDNLRVISNTENKLPVIVAGDIFDKWDNPAELVNFAIHAIGRMGEVYAIPGQHDLPNHSYKDIKRSSYHTLVEAGVIVNLPPGEAYDIDKRLAVAGYPWGYEPHDNTQTNAECLLCVIHKYIWWGHHHPQAKLNDRVDKFKNSFDDFDAFVAGDNHGGYLYEKNFLVPGTLMRRTSDEVKYIPTVGILYSNGRIERRALDTHLDKFREDLHTGDEKLLEDSGVDYDQFVKALREMGDAHHSFNDAVLKAVSIINPSAEVRQRVLEILEKE